MNINISFNALFSNPFILDLIPGSSSAYTEKTILMRGNEAEWCDSHFQGASKKEDRPCKILTR